MWTYKKISTCVDLWNIKLEMRVLKLGIYILYPITGIYILWCKKYDPILRLRVWSRCTKKLVFVVWSRACKNKRENYYKDTNMVLNMPYSVNVYRCIATCITISASYIQNSRTANKLFFIYIACMRACIVLDLGMKTICI
jgi:hypothetical protein